MAPAALFPDVLNNTQRKTALDAAEYDRAFHDFDVMLPRLEEELAELKRIQPESMEALKQKKAEIEKIERKIDASLSGKSDQETVVERKQRLRRWFNEETIILGGKNGALIRTAEREGISRQALSEILKRK